MKKQEMRSLRGKVQKRGRRRDSFVAAAGALSGEVEAAAKLSRCYGTVE